MENLKTISTFLSVQKLSINQGQTKSISRKDAILVNVQSMNTINHNFVTIFGVHYCRRKSKITCKK